MKTKVKAETPRSARKIEVIETQAIRGDGLEDPVRIVTQYWNFEGELLAEHDPVRSESNE